MLPSVKIEDIETAIRVIECNHFTQAGKKMHKEQPTVSRCIKRVERGIGAELIDRSAHPVRPTKAGTAFLYWGRKGLYALARGFTEVHRISKTSRLVLHVGYTSYLDLDVLAYVEHLQLPGGSEFSHREHSSSTSEVITAVLANKWDCGFIISPTTTTGLVGMPIYQEPFGVVVANDHPLARKRRIALGDLRDVPLILPARERNTGFRAWFVQRCGAEGVRLNVAHEVGNPHEGWFLASQHAGAAFMPKSASKNLPKGSTVFRSFAEHDLYAEIQLVFRDEPQSALLVSFANAIVQMRERHLRGKLTNNQALIAMIPRSVVKPWKAPRSSHHGIHSLSA